jgi:hypothetical protein
MLTFHTKVVRIEEAHRQARLSPAQKKFNATIKKIDKQKKLLAVWQETIPRYQQMVAEKFIPLRQTYGKHQVEMVQLLDEHHGNKRFTRNQKKKIGHLICELCSELINTHEREDLKPIYNKYSEFYFDTEDQEAAALAGDFIKSMLECELGIELDDKDVDVNSPEKMAAFVQEKLEAQQRQADERRGKRKKTAKQLEKEARQQAEEAKLGKSIQTVYRQLVTALHPDREQDPVERGRKTELMQQVTVAYGKKDLLQLLELQLAVEQIDQSNLNTIAADRLKYYNKILQGQLEQLMLEVVEIEFMLKQQAGLAPYVSLSPKRLLSTINEDIERLQDEIARIRHDLVTFQDINHLRAWLKEYRIPAGRDEMMDPLDVLFFGDEFPPFGLR